MNYLLYRMSVVHRKLDNQIDRETKWRWSDPARLASLKKLRLALKDRIAGHIKTDVAFTFGQASDAN
ncbi:MAG: YdcH family protein [Rhodospirillaceae bacterium]|nr:YdcH family protein [Rhodospirillaceae bacterium]